MAKRRKLGLRFRYAEDAVATRMYRTTGAMMEGWTKNLALLFDNALATAVWRVLDIFLLFGLPWLAVRMWNARFAHIRWNGWAPGGYWRCCGCGTCSVFTRGWRNRIFRLWIARSRPWACRCCLSALSELVPASGAEAGELEGPDISRVHSEEVSA